MSLNMLQLDKVVLPCYILCGMFVVYYMPLYVVVSVIAAILIYVYYESQVNGSRIHVRGLPRPSPLRKLLYHLRFQANSTLVSIMNSFRQVKPVSNKTNANGANEIYMCRETNERNSLDISPKGYANTSNNFTSLAGDTIKSNERRRTVSPYSVASSDSLFSGSRSFKRNEQSGYLTPKRHSRGSNDMNFSPKGSPWGTSVSPKLRSHGTGVKTVQTVAGPLLASTRYNININSGLYGDVNSPGFSSRVARYAGDNSKSLTHQRQYSGPGQFPLVQLDRSASKLPIVSPRKGSGIIHTPVTVRVAPPEALESRLLNKSQILSGSCLQDQDSTKSVLEALKEISRKRIHSQLDDDSEGDIVKRQRKGEGQSSMEHRTEENLEGDPLSIGKRGREESPGQDDSNSRMHQQVSKRTRNNEILSSLSSSRNLMKQMKRKSSAADWSRSSTPVLGKQPKQSRDVLREATSLLMKTNTTTISTTTTNTCTINTTVTTTTSTAIVAASTDKSDEIPEVVKPSEFLPKFAAVLNKNSAPELNSIAALEAKHANDTRTRLRSMLAVIAGDDDFMKRQDAQKDESPATTVNIVFPSSNTVTSTMPSLPAFAQSKSIPDSENQSSNSGGFTSSNANTVIEVSNPSTSESSKSLVSFGTTSPPTSSIAGNANNTITTVTSTPGGTLATTSSGFTVGTSPTSTASGFTLGVTSNTPTTTTGFTAATTSSGLTFGSKSITTASGGSPSTPATTASSLAFGSTPKTTSGFTLAGSSSMPAATSSGFAFGSTPITSSAITFRSSPATTSTITFGSLPATTSAVTFGSSPANTSALMFGSLPASTSSAITFGSSSATTSSAVTVGSSPATTSTVTFGSMPSSTASGFTLGANSSTASGLTFGSTPLPTTSGFILGGTSSSSPGFTLGSNKPSTTVSSFTLPSPSPSAESVSSNASVSLFTTKSNGEKEIGLSKSNEKQTVAITSPLFGVSKENSLATNVSSSTSLVTVFGTANKDAPVFGAPKNNEKKDGIAAPAFGTTNSLTMSAGNSVTPKTSEKESCKTPSTSGVIFGTTTTSLASPAPVSLFGTSKASEKSNTNASTTFASGIFGITKNNDKGPVTSTSTAPVNIFGTVRSNEKESNSTTSVGIATTTSSSAVTIFGANKASDTTSSTSLFGKPATASSGLFNFGAKTSPAAANPFQLPAPASQPGGFKFDLGSSKTDKENAVMPVASQSITSVTTPSTTSQTTTLFQFKPTFNFGTTVTANGPTQNTGGFAFGGPQKSQPGLFSFGSSTSTNTMTSTTGTFSFDANKPSGFGFSGSGSSSSQSTQSSTGGFGGTGTTQPLFGTSGVKQEAQPAGGLFGSSTTPSSNLFSAPNSGTPFGSSSNTASPAPAGIFGSGGTVPAQPFGQTNSTFGSGLFGSTTTTTTQPSSTFGSTSTPAFGSAPTSSSQSTVSAFGSPAPTFGSTPQPNTFSSGQSSGPLFGSSSATQPTFGFGSSSSAPAVQQPAPSSGTNLFGGGATPFQFGAGSSGNTAAPATGGFNFSTTGVNASTPAINFGAGTSATPAFQFGAGGTSTQPLFGAQNTGQSMFSIGSGSTAPRARSRLRRQR